MFSFTANKGGKPVAVVVGGSHDGKVLYVDPDHSEFDHLILNDGKLDPIPDVTTERNIIFLPAASGAGKSWWAKNFMKRYKQLYPMRDMIVFSKLREDESLDGLDIKRVNLEKLAEKPFQAEDLKDSAVLLDDCDCISDKTQLQAVEKLQHQVLEVGRHHNITALITAHQANRSGGKSKSMCLESHRIILFPKSGVPYTRLLTAYCGWEPQEVIDLMKLPYRWIMLMRHAPQSIITECEAFPRRMLQVAAQRHVKIEKQPVTLEIGGNKSPEPEPKEPGEKKEKEKELPKPKQSFRLPAKRARRGRPPQYRSVKMVHCLACDNLSTVKNIARHKNSLKHIENMERWAKQQ